MSAAEKIRETAKTLNENEVAKKFQASTNQVKLAGLGVVASATEESSKIFDSLVKQGQEFEQRTAVKVQDVRKLAENRVQQVRQRASTSLEKLEQVFEERVQQVLTKLGIPTREELNALNEKIEALRASLESKRKRLR